jgi:hydroxymethylglutaryl-CoA reductase
MIVGAVGLASNLAALRALVTEGIQRGHMALHRRSSSLAGPARAGGDAEAALLDQHRRRDGVRLGDPTSDGAPGGTEIPLHRQVS